MIIKKFQGKTEEEAVAAARKELGNGVVIMNVKTLKRKGLAKLFKKPVTEVTVALEDEQTDRNAYRQPSVPKANKDIIEEPKAERTPTYSSGPVAENGKAIEEKLENLHTLIEQQLSKEQEEPSLEEQKKKEEGSNAFIKLIYDTLIDNEVSEKYAHEITDEISKIKKSNVTLDFVLANIYQKMILQFGQPSVITPATENAKVVFFIGPTGVGKTTTIAKIASQLCVNEKKKVALLTTDTYRIAAAEQLRTYASILDVPFRVIYTAEEIIQTVNDYKNFDYILVDTAGHAHNNDALRNSMSSFIKALDEDMFEKEIYLVVSATTKYRDLVNIADAYDEFKGYKLIFTKLDETTTLGNLFNLRMHTNATMSYVTCGQNVPDDIAKFSPQSTVKQLLGGK